MCSELSHGGEGLNHVGCVGGKIQNEDDHEAEDVHHRVADVGQGKQSREVGDGLYETR